MSPTAEARAGAEVERWARAILALLGRLPGVLRAGLAIAEGGGRRLMFTADDREAAGDLDWCEVDAFEDVPLNNAIRTGRHVAGTLSELAARYPVFVARQAPTTEAVAAVPLVASGHVLGGFVLFLDVARGIGPAELDRLSALGARLGEELYAVQRRGRAPAPSSASPAASADATAVSRAFDGDPQAVASARHFTRATLAAWGIDPDAVETATLCVSELVTNAVIHSGTGCEVWLTRTEDSVLLGVRDAGRAGSLPEIRTATGTPDPLAVRGRGLQLVEALSTAWGHELSAMGMTVWCELAVG